MSRKQVFKLPDLGEGLTESEVLSWKVAVGDTVKLNQVIAEVETAKAVVEIPSPYSGTVRQLHAEPGQVVEVGGALVTFDSGDSGEPSEPSEPSEQGAEPGDDPAPERTPTLVGYGAPAASSQRPQRRARRTAAPQSATAAAPDPTQPAAVPVRDSIGNGAVRCRPPVRKFARDHGIDLHRVQGSGPEGLILREDVERAMAAEPTATAVASTEASTTESRTPQRSGDERVIPVTGVRRATANAMVESAFSAPHVTEFLTVDVTETLNLIERLRTRKSLRDVRINFLTVLGHMVSRLLAHHRGLNSTWDEGGPRIIEHSAVHLGIAMDTERGLLVPVVDDVQSLGLDQWAGALAEVIEAGRAGTLNPQQLRGATFAITNVGVFGVDAGTPILPPGLSGILSVGRIRRRPWEYRGEVALRQTVTLGLSFDHRVVDGAQGGRFLADLGSILEDPGVIQAFV